MLFGYDSQEGDMWLGKTFWETIGKDWVTVGKGSQLKGAVRTSLE